MIEITTCLILSIFVLLKPTIIPYLALLYLFTVGLTSPEFIATHLKITLGNINIFPPDLLYALAVIFSLTYFVKNFSNYQFNRANSSETKTTARLVLIFVFFFIGKLINGLFNSVPIDSLVRLFMADTSALYFFLPFVIYKDISQLKHLMRFTVVLSLIFPLCQPFLIYSTGTQFILHGQGTFRLGYGDANVLLALGAIALFCWEYKRYLTFLPLAGIMMLAHRSAYIAIVLSIMALSFFKGKKIQTLALVGMAGILVIGMLVVLGSFTNINILDKNLSRAGETFQATGTTVARANILTVVIEELQKRPLTGLDYKELQDLINNSEHSHHSFNITHPHNFVFSAIFNTGLIGTLILFILITRSMQIAYKLAQTEIFKTEGTFLYSSILFFIVFSSMNTTMGSVGYVLWFLCGLTFLLYNQYRMDK